MVLNIKDTPWRALGTSFDTEDNSAHSAAEAAGLDWEVMKRPLMFLDSNNGFKTLGDKAFAVTKSTDDSVLGVVGSRYTPIQNIEAFGIMDALVESGQASFLAAGEFDNGSTVWAQIKLGDPIVIAGEDEIIRNLTLFNSHDGNLSLSMMITPLRVFCMNQLAVMKASSASSFTLRHTKGIVNKLAASSREIIETNARIEQAAEAFKFLAAKAIGARALNEFLALLFPASDSKVGETMAQKRRMEIMNLYQDGRGTSMTPHTLWRAWNAVVEWVDYYRGKTDSSRMRSALIGNGHKLKQRALSIALEMTK